jgi:glycosyltransferase involved in cell wall biosynthesis
MTTAAVPLRVAMMLSSDGPGGAEMMTFRLSEELRQRGSTVIYVGPHRGSRWLRDVYHGAGFVDELVPIGRSWIDVPFARALTRVLRKHAIDVVHGHEFDMAVYGAACARWIGIPNIVTMHGGLTVTHGWHRHLALRWAYRHSASTVVVSAATRTQFAGDLHLPESTFTVIPNGVPTTPGDAQRVRQEFDCTHGETVLLAVGTLERNKGHQILLEALALLNNQGLAVPWKLIIAGGRGGDQHESLLAFARAHGLEARVRIVTGRTDIADLQALADIFVMPSYREGMPMALLEAMVAGTAIVASHTGGIPEAVSDGVEGLLVPPGDAEALARALHVLFTDGSRRALLAEAARARGHREFSISVMTDRYLELYHHARQRQRA